MATFLGIVASVTFPTRVAVLANKRFAESAAVIAQHD